MPILKALNDFKKVLKNYHPSAKTIDALQSVRFVLLAAPTAAGRNTIIKKLVATGRYHYVISDTTRQPRYNNRVTEQNGVEYWFKTESQILQGLREGSYIEAAIIHNQQVSGISGSELINAANQQVIAITDIEIHGCDTIKKLNSSVITIFILPPTFDVWMSRLKQRGVMLKAEKERRLKSAIQEIQLALSRPYFYFIINENLEQTTRDINDYIANSDKNAADQVKARSHANQLLIDLQISLQ